MNQSKELAVEAIEANDMSKLKSLLNSINIREANFHIVEESQTKNMNNQYRANNSGPQNVEGIPLEQLNLLHVAAYYNSFECFRYLAQEEGNNSLRTLSAAGYYPLHYACYRGSYEIALYILTNDPAQAIPDTDGEKEHSLLYCAIFGSDSEILCKIFEYGAKITNINEENKLISLAISLQDKDILSILMQNSIKTVNSQIDSTHFTPAMKAVICHNLEAFELLYSGQQDLKAYVSNENSNFTLIGLICEFDVTKKFRKKLIEILRKDAMDITIEPPSNNTYQQGVCHWACLYNDLEVAELMFKTPNVIVNRFDNRFKLGPVRLVSKKNSDVIPMLSFLIDKGLDINLRKDLDSPTLLESFISFITKNYQAIQFLVDNHADIEAPHSNKKGKRIIDVVRDGKDEKLKKIFKLI